MQLFANNALSTLAAALTDVATSLSVQPGHGARFPAPVGGDFFLITLFQLVGGIEANHEIVKVTARAIDTLTIVRAQEGTTARAWGVGDQVSHRGTAGSLAGLAQLGAPANFALAVSFPTAAAGTNTTQGATTAFVTAAVAQGKADLVASSPAALDTLNELATALGNDANFAASTATSLGNRLRVDVNNQALTAAQMLNGLTNLGIPNVNNTSDANKPISTAAANELALKAPLLKPAFTGSMSLAAVVGGSAYMELAGNGNVVGTASMLYGQDATSAGYVWNRAAAPVFFATSGAERMRIMSAGNVLIGTTADNGTDRLQVAGTIQSSGGVRSTAAGIITVLSADATGTYLETQGAFATRFFTNGVERVRIMAAGNVLIATTVDNGADKLQVNGSTTVLGKISVNAGNDVGFSLNDGLAIQRKSGGAMGFLAANVEAMRIDSYGNLLIGAASGANHIINRIGSTEGTVVLSIQGAGTVCGYFQDARGTGVNAANTGFAINKHSTTLRSINAAGTINASGADYAEYMVKDDACSALTKGQVVGVTIDGKLTDRWDKSVSFMIKSTDPSYVGADTWGVGLEGDELEAARQKVDRIAFAGQVPVNVFDAKPGQYIVPGNFGGTVGGCAMDAAKLTPEFYIRAVGIVQNILPDGRANVRVKVA